MHFGEGFKFRDAEIEELEFFEDLKFLLNLKNHSVALHERLKVEIRHKLTLLNEIKSLKK